MKSFKKEDALTSRRNFQNSGGIYEKRNFWGEKTKESPKDNQRRVTDHVPPAAGLVILFT